jgi:ribosomal protein S18 acetylase RimI-like enzyme
VTVARTVRPARPADAAPLRGLQRAAIADPAPELLELALATAGDASDGPRCPVAVAGGGPQPVGYALALEDGAICYVAELAVAAAHRRRGHGTALVDALAADTAAGELRLTVRADDGGARKFYAARGFEAVGHTDRFDGDGLVLAREL